MDHLGFAAWIKSPELESIGPTRVLLRLRSAKLFFQNIASFADARAANQARANLAETTKVFGFFPGVYKHDAIAMLATERIMLFLNHAAKAILSCGCVIFETDELAIAAGTSHGSLRNQELSSRCSCAAAGGLRPEAQPVQVRGRPQKLTARRRYPAI